MNKTESIARKILGWKLNKWDRWYDSEKEIFIHDHEFQPEVNLGHAMLVVERLEKFGYKFTRNGNCEVRFNNINASGNTLAEAITDAAYSIIEHSTIDESRDLWSQLC
jgi:hypothetical protein